MDVYCVYFPKNFCSFQRRAREKEEEEDMLTSKKFVARKKNHTISVEYIWESRREREIFIPARLAGAKRGAFFILSMEKAL